MATVHKAHIGMFDDIHALLDDPHAARPGPDEWRALFGHSRKNDDEAAGFVLVRHSSIVGFVGTIFSRRRIEGKTERFCNISNWMVKPDFHTEGIRLLLPLLGLRGCTLTNFSASYTACRILERLGFHYLDTDARIFYPPPLLFRLEPTSEYSVLTDADAIAPVLSPSDRNLLQDHRQYRCGHLLLRHNDGGRHCYCMYTTITRNSLRFSHIQYISDKAVFLNAIDAAGYGLFSREKTLFMKVDSRMVGGRPVPRSIRFNVPSPRMYRSASLRPDQIDNLYSDLIIQHA